MKKSEMYKSAVYSVIVDGSQEFDEKFEVVLQLCSDYSREKFREDREEGTR